MIDADRLTPAHLALFRLARTTGGRMFLADIGCPLTAIPRMTREDAAGLIARLTVMAAVAGLAPEVRQ